MKTEIILFEKNELVTVSDDNETIYVAIKPICDAIGLHADSAVRGIKNHPVLGAWHTVQHVMTDKNRAYPHSCLPIEYVNGWLFSIDINKVKPEAQELLIMYQRECYKVLYEHFYGAIKIIKQNINRRFQIVKEIKEVNRQINVLMKKHKDLEKERDAIDKNNYLQMGLQFDDVIEIQETGFHLN